MFRSFKILGVKFGSRSGFTLIEILIVVIVLGILAMIIIPQVTAPTEDAKLNALKTNLGAMRNAIELYYHQHNSKYPGAVDHTDGDGAPPDAAATFKLQLTLYSNAKGQTSEKLDKGNFPYGPYLKDANLPTNPFMESSDLVCDTSTIAITARGEADPASPTAWKFYTQTGVFVANDGDGHNGY